jgi:hypothetical protein
VRESLVSAADWRLALAALDQPLGEVFSAHVDASAWDGDDENPTDLTEAYFEYRPYPRAGFRSRVRLGAYYPPFSLENRAHGWETPYAITPSAIDSWIARKSAPSAWRARPSTSRHRAFITPSAFAE